MAKKYFIGKEAKILKTPNEMRKPTPIETTNTITIGAITPPIASETCCPKINKSGSATVTEKPIKKDKATKYKGVFAWATAFPIASPMGAIPISIPNKKMVKPKIKRKAPIKKRANISPDTSTKK